MAQGSSRMIRLIIGGLSRFTGLTLGGFWVQVLRRPLILGEAGKYRIEGWKRAAYRFRRNSLSIAGLIVVAGILSIGVLADYVAPYPKDALGAVNWVGKLKPPSWEHPFGMDEAGRDVLSRAIFATRVDVSAAFTVQALVTAIGVVLGMIAGYMGGRVNDAIMRFADVFITIPPLVLAMAATTAFTPHISTAILAVTVAWWPWYARLVQSVVLSVKEEQYVEASRSMGKGSMRIILEDIFPNIISVVIVKFTLDIGFVILFMASLSFLGLGVQPPTPAWGTMIAEGRIYLPDFWWMSAFPGVFILLSVVGFSLLGDGLRDALDVQLEE